MDKKGAIKTIVGIMILLVLLVAILFSFFFPGSPAPTIAKGAEKLGDSILGGLRGGEEFQKKALGADPGVEGAYEDIVGLLRKPGDGPCILMHREFQEDFKGHNIKLQNEEGGIRVEMVVRAGKSGQKRLGTDFIEGKPLCVVAGTAAKNFHHNYIDSSVGCSTSDCQPEYIIVESITFS